MITNKINAVSQWWRHQSYLSTAKSWCPPWYWACNEELRESWCPPWYWACNEELRESWCPPWYWACNEELRESYRHSSCFNYARRLRQIRRTVGPEVMKKLLTPFILSRVGLITATLCSVVKSAKYDNQASVVWTISVIITMFSGWKIHIGIRELLFLLKTRDNKCVFVVYLVI